MKLLHLFRIAAVVSFLLVPPAFGQKENEQAVFPGESWEVIESSALANYGWSSDGLTAATKFIVEESNATGIMVIDGGRVAFQYGDVEEISYVASVRKSILAILYGKHVANGTIRLDKTIGEIGMDDIGGLMEVEKQATIEHLITARSGVYHIASNYGDNLASAPERGSKQPGTYMLYSNWDFNAAGAAFELETGENIFDSLEKQLAEPLGFENWDRSLHVKTGDLTRSVNPAYHMHLSTQDMARIGYLMLREGRWENDQLVPKDWIRKISGIATPLEEMNPDYRREGYFGYGCMWWVWDGPRAKGPFKGAYTARGAFGQWITVMPAVDLVIAHKTKRAYRRATSWESWQRTMELILESKQGVKLEAPYPWR